MLRRSVVFFDCVLIARGKGGSEGFCLICREEGKCKRIYVTLCRDIDKDLGLFCSLFLLLGFLLAVLVLQLCSIAQIRVVVLFCVDYFLEAMIRLVLYSLLRLHRYKFLSIHT